MTVPDVLVTIGSYSTPYEANLVRSELEAFEVDAILVDVYTVSINWLWSNALGGIKVQVPESEANEAQRILEMQPDNEPDEQDLAEVVVFICPVCGSANIHYFLDKRGAFLTWLILGIPVIPPISKMACADCGSKWKA